MTRQLEMLIEIGSYPEYDKVLGDGLLYINRPQRHRLPAVCCENRYLSSLIEALPMVQGILTGELEIRLVNSMRPPDRNWTQISMPSAADFFAY